MSIIDAIINNPNCPFTEENIEELKQMSPELLQRIALLGSQPQAETESSSAEASLRNELKACQEELVNLYTSEREIRKELEAYGVKEGSVLEQIFPVAVANQRGGGCVTEEAVLDFVNNSKSNLAEMLREGIDAREQGRSKAVQTILQSTDQFTKQELSNMTTPNLLKVAAALGSRKRDRFETPVYNWDVTAFADRSVGSSGYLGAPLEVSSTSPPLNP